MVPVPTLMVNKNFTVVEKNAYLQSSILLFEHKMNSFLSNFQVLVYCHKIIIHQLIFLLIPFQQAKLVIYDKLINLLLYCTYMFIWFLNTKNFVLWKYSGYKNFIKQKLFICFFQDIPVVSYKFCKMWWFRLSVLLILIMTGNSIFSFWKSGNRLGSIQLSYLMLLCNFSNTVWTSKYPLM